MATGMKWKITVNALDISAWIRGWKPFRMPPGQLGRGSLAHEVEKKRGIVQRRRLPCFTSAGSFSRETCIIVYLKSVGPKSITVTEYNLDLIMLGPCTLLRRPFYFFLAGGPNLRGWKLNPAVFHFIYYSLVL